MMLQAPSQLRGTSEGFRGTQGKFVLYTVLEEPICLSVSDKDSLGR